MESVQFRRSDHLPPEKLPGVSLIVDGHKNDMNLGHKNDIPLGGGRALPTEDQRKSSDLFVNFTQRSPREVFPDHVVYGQQSHGPPKIPNP